MARRREVERAVFCGDLLIPVEFLQCPLPLRRTIGAYQRWREAQTAWAVDHGFMAGDPDRDWWAFGSLCSRQLRERRVEWHQLCADLREGHGYGA